MVNQIVTTLKVLSIIGTRPEAVKMAPLVLQFRMHPQIVSRVLVTAQHRDMLDQVLKVFGIVPDYDLDVMRPNQSPTDVIASVLSALQPILKEFTPDWVLVQGDTTSALAGAIGASYAGCRVGHVEAGLRTYDRHNPFPEELNRVLVDHSSNLCFAPTALARLALLREGISDAKVFVTGNTVIDALRHIAGQEHEALPVALQTDKKMILVTAHRRENHGQPIRNIALALLQLSTRSDIQIVYPVHRNPSIADPIYDMLEGRPNITLTRPLDYLSFVHLMRKANIILTDSGGVQEEAPTFGIPVIVLRNVTERQEAVMAGTARIAGTDTETIVRETVTLLEDETAYRAMSQSVSPFGDGAAAKRIVDILLTTPISR